MEPDWEEWVRVQRREEVFEETGIPPVYDPDGDGHLEGERPPYDHDDAESDAATLNYLLWRFRGELI